MEKNMLRMATTFLAVFMAAGAINLAAAEAVDREAVDRTEIADANRCLPKSEMIDYLKRAWSEVPVAEGALSNGNPTTLYLSRRGTWTLVEKRQDGKACVEASGSNMSVSSFRAAKLNNRV
jgi:hypothetical protein